MTRYVLLLCVLLGGCDMYFGGGDDWADDTCAEYGGGPGVPAAEVRDPSTGQCSYYSNTGGYCSCGVCPEEPTTVPDWGSCSSACTGLSEQTCTTTPGCYNAWLESGDSAMWWGCFETAPSGPIAGTCAGLSAYECSRHDDCRAYYVGGKDGTLFDYCEAEPDPTCPLACGPDSHCAVQCQGTTCDPVCVANETCATHHCPVGYTCDEACTVDASGTTVCIPACVPSTSDPGSCTGTITCTSPAPACPSGTTPGINNGCYTGYCIPLASCGPGNPGECYGTVTCTSGAPACPTGTVPGVLNGCYTGFCIPQSQCPLPACSTLSSENACVMRSDCVPVYDGQNCTCYPDHCECQILTYERCETR